MNRKTKALLAALLAMLVLAGCSSVSTDTNETAVHVGGGSFEAKVAKDCIPPSTRQNTNSPNDKYYYYPVGQIAYDFTGRENSDSSPISVISKDNQTLTIPGQVTMTLKTDCDSLKDFHNKFGKNLVMYMEKDDEGNFVRSAGWRRGLNLYVGRALDSTLDRVAKNYTRDDLFSKPNLKDTINAEVDKTLAALVKQQMAGKEYFTGWTTNVNQPDPGETYRRILTEQQQVVAQAKATEQKAVAEARAAKAAADAQVAQKESERQVAVKQAQIKAAEIRAYGSVEAYTKAKLAEQGLNPYQPSYGGTPLVQPEK